MSEGTEKTLEKGFVHLRVHSSLSLAEGAIHSKELVKLAQKNDMPAVAITDTNNLFGALEFSLAASDYGIQPIIGCQLSIQRPRDEAVLGQIKAPDHLVVLAQNEQGYLNLMALSSKEFLEADGLPEPQIPLSAVKDYSEGLIALTGGVQGGVGRLLLEGQNEAAEALLLELKAMFPERLYVEIQRHNMAAENKIEPFLIELAYKHDIPLVATNDVFFSNEAMYEAHDALLCIAQGVVVDETNRRRLTPDHRFKSINEMRLLFADLPEAVDNTVVIAQRCAVMPKKVKPILPPFDTAGGRSEVEELRAQAHEGLDARLAAGAAYATPEEYRTRLDFELDVIVKMGFPGYFLIVSDFIKWAKLHDIPVGPGRGSGAGSVVAWALTITDLDPLRFNLLFERFLNPERVSMPDFDVDFCQDRRDEVISYVQQKYGRDKVAQIITFGKMQARAVLRDVGRALGFAWGRVDKICKLIPNNPADPMTIEQALANDPALRAKIAEEEGNDRLIELAQKLEGLYRHASTHAAGVVIADRPLEKLVALFRDPRSDIPATQFNMKYVEQAGLVKYDFLGLKTITVIKKAVDMVAANDGLKINLSTLTLEDKKTYELLGRAETLGVFQVESAGMRDILRKMKPDRLEDLVALVALYRPGPMDNIPTYIAVKNGQQEPDYMHPMLEPILKETYGIMVYQEQVMQLAQLLAGYSLGGADLLRRAMGKKIKAEMDAQRAIFVEGAVKNNVPAAQAEMIFDKVAKFAEYGFNKSHAAAYALVSYQTAYLKANHPAEFMAASMTYEMGNTEKLGQFRQELGRMGIKLLPPDINRSFATFATERLPDGSKAVRYALAALKGVGIEAMNALVQEREAQGTFKDWADLVRRVDLRAINRKSLESLTKAGALDSLNPNRAQILASMDLILAYGQQVQAEKNSGQSSLFGEAEDVPPPVLPKTNPFDSMTKLQEEFLAIGFFLSAHPLDQYKPILDRLKIVSSGQLAAKAQKADNTRFRVAGVVLSRQEKISKNGNRFAFLQMSDSAGVFESMMFSEILVASRQYLEAGSRVVATMDVQLQEEGVRLTCFGIEPLDEILDRVQSGITIRLDDVQELDKLKTIIEQNKGGKQKLTLSIPLNAEKEAEVQLGSGYNLTQEVQAAIRGVFGVLEVVGG